MNSQNPPPQEDKVPPGQEGFASPSEFRAGFDEELRYWDSEMTLHGLFPEQLRLRLYQPETVYPGAVREAVEGRFRELGRLPQVLDVGSGPASILAHGALTGRMQLTAVDPLADEYVRLLEKHGRPQLCPLVRGTAEDLTELFGREAFDLVWMCNALDHSEHPVRAFAELFRVLRADGLLFVSGTVREGTRQSWNGLHQHDLYVEEGRLYCVSKDASSGRLLPPVCLDCGLDLELLSWVGGPVPPGVSGTFFLVWRKTRGA